MDIHDSVNFLGMTLAEFAATRGKHPQGLRQEYRARMRKGEGLTLPEVTRRRDCSEDGTVKFCLPLEPSAQDAAATFLTPPGSGLNVLSDVPAPKPQLETESVIIPMVSYRGSSWHTLCISSQVGCRMGCTFCETGRMGLIRNLTAGEIVRQRLAARLIRMAMLPPFDGPDHSYFADGIQNIVFMGMGEPLDNFDNLTQAIRVLSEPQGMNFPHQQICVSTVGRVDGLRKLGELKWPNLRIAVSLNAANDRLRDELMPINKGMPLAELKRALEDYPMSQRGLYLIEYVLIKGVNDSLADADAVAAFCKGLRCIVNVIPYNPQRYATFETPSDETIVAFMKQLKTHRVFVKRRITHGRTLMGACGQLGNPEVRRKGLVVAK